MLSDLLVEVLVPLPFWMFVCAVSPSIELHGRCWDRIRGCIAWAAACSSAHQLVMEYHGFEEPAWDSYSSIQTAQLLASCSPSLRRWEVLLSKQSNRSSNSVTLVLCFAPHHEHQMVLASRTSTNYGRRRLLLRQLDLELILRLLNDCRTQRRPHVPENPTGKPQ